MSRARATVRIALYCANPRCSEQVLVEATRSDGDRGAFEVRVLPPGWSEVGDPRDDRGAPYELPALCPLHRRDLRPFLVRSIEEVTARLRAKTDLRSRDRGMRLDRCKRAVAMWAVVEPTEEQVEAMAAVVAELRAEVGLPPGLATGVHRVRK